MTPTIANLSGFETFTSVSPTALSSYCTVTFCKNQPYRDSLDSLGI